MIESDSDATKLGELRLLPRRREPPNLMAADLLKADEVLPPRTLLEASDYMPPSNPIEVMRYTSRSFHDLEIAKMWGRVWQYACWSGDIPNPGDVSVYKIAGQSILVVRQTDGSLKAFRNSCRHRGMTICREDGNHAALRCPYHAFTWDLSGKFLWMSAEWDFPQIDQANFGLFEVRVEEWNSFVFINLDPQAQSLKSYLGKMVDQWSEWDFSTRYRSVTVERKMNCNWKSCLDAFIEAYHVVGTHPEALYLSSETATQCDVYPDEPHFSRFHVPTGIASENISPRPSEQEVFDCYVSTYMPEIFGTSEADLGKGETARAAIGRLARKVYRDRLGMNMDNVPNSELLDGTEYFVFPNMLVWPSVASPLVYRFRPGDTPDTSIWETSIFLRFEGERPAPGPVYKLDYGEPMADIKELGWLGPILQQDADALEVIQQGMNSTGNGLIETAHYQEGRIRHYHETIDKYIKG